MGLEDLMDGKVLITGGSGFLGINLIRHLLEKGFEDIESLDRLEFDYPERDRVKTVLGDIRDQAVVDRCVQGSRWVIHTAAALPLYSPEEIMTTDVDGSWNLLDSALAHGVDRFIMISSTAVYGIPDHHPLLETDPMVGVGPYGEAKVRAEKLCLEYREKGLCVSVLRPKSFVGPERLGVFALLYDWAKDGHSFPMIGSGHNRYQLLDVADLCEAIYLCMTLPREKVDDVFNIGAERFETMREDYQAVLDRAGHGKRIIGFPARPVIWALRVLEALNLSPLYKWVYETACEDSFVSIDKAKEVLGFQPRYSNQEALLRNFEWYLENLPRFQQQSGVTHRVPWKQGALGIIKKVF